MQHKVAFCYKDYLQKNIFQKKVIDKGTNLGYLSMYLFELRVNRA